jgi:hypothetical protein
LIYLDLPGFQPVLASAIFNLQPATLTSLATIVGRIKITGFSLIWDDSQHQVGAAGQG